ncbi:hypothetical protein EG329_001409 [Mollisiaceae sp. DMI_Dod_QoI]|nr:hypothetical protein EG329_001409 [Helotiales sp. DMI_Dod_QoI]
MDSKHESILIGSSPETKPSGATIPRQPLARNSSTGGDGQSERGRALVQRISLMDIDTSTVSGRRSYGIQSALRFPGETNEHKTERVAPLAYQTQGLAPPGKPVPPALGPPPGLPSDILSDTSRGLRTVMPSTSPAPLPAPSTSQVGPPPSIPTTDPEFQGLFATQAIRLPLGTTIDHEHKLAQEVSQAAKSAAVTPSWRPSLNLPPAPLRETAATTPPRTYSSLLPVDPSLARPCPEGASTSHQPIPAPKGDMSHSIATTPVPPSMGIGTSANSRSISNVELSYKTEHSVMCAVQKILEETLYDFAKKYIPALLDKMRWQTAEHGELNRWKDVLYKFKGDVIFAFKAINSNLSYPEFLEVLIILHELRHIAVHRLPIGTYGLKRFMPHALELVLGLQDAVRYNKLRVIEWGVWQPKDVNLEAELMRPLQEFTDMLVPERKDFIRAADLYDPYLVPGTRNKTILGPRSSTAGPTGISRQFHHLVPNPTASLGSKHMPRKRNRQSRSPEPHSRVLRSSRTKRTKVQEVIDLTDDGEKESTTRTEALSGAKVVIDLTDD